MADQFEIVLAASSVSRATRSMRAASMIGADICRARRRIGMTRVQLADNANLPLSVVLDTELGVWPVAEPADAGRHPRAFSEEALLKIAGALDVSALRWIAEARAIRKGELENERLEESVRHG